MVAFTPTSMPENPTPIKHADLFILLPSSGKTLIKQGFKQNFVGNLFCILLFFTQMRLRLEPEWFGVMSFGSGWGTRRIWVKQPLSSCWAFQTSHFLEDPVILCFQSQVWPQSSFLQVYSLQTFTLFLSPEGYDAAEQIVCVEIS